MARLQRDAETSGLGSETLCLIFFNMNRVTLALLHSPFQGAYVCKRSSLSLKAEGCTLPEGPSIAYNKLWNRRPVEYEVWQRAAAASAAPAAAAAAAEAWTALGGSGNRGHDCFNICLLVSVNSPLKSRPLCRSSIPHTMRAFLRSRQQKRLRRLTRYRRLQQGLLGRTATGPFPRRIQNLLCLCMCPCKILSISARSFRSCRC